MAEYVEQRLLAGCSVIHIVNDGSGVIIAAMLPLIQREFFLNYFQIGILLAANLVILGCFQIFFGYLAERFSEKNLLSIGLTIVMVSSFLISNSQTFFELFFFNCMAAIGASAFHPANFALISRVYEGNVYRDKVMGLVTGAGDFGVLIAFFSTGVIGQLFGWRLSFLIWAILAVIAITIHIFLSKNSPYSCSNTDSSSIKTEIRMEETPNHSMVKWELLLILILMFCVGAAYRTYLAFTPLFLTNIKGLRTATADSLMGLMIAVGVISISLSGYIFKYGKRRIELISLFLLGIVSILFTLVSTIEMLILLLLVGFSLYIIYQIIITMVADLTHFEKRGRSYGVFMSIRWAGDAFAAFIGGILSEIFGLFIIYLFVAVIMFSCLGLVSTGNADLWSRKEVF